MNLHPKVIAARQKADKATGGCIFAVSEAVAAAQAEVDAERCEQLVRTLSILNADPDNWDKACVVCAAAIRSGLQ